MLVSLPAEPILDHEVVALDPAQPAQHLPDYFGLPSTGHAIPWREKSDACGFPRLLPFGGERRGECGSQASHEGAAVHPKSLPASGMLAPRAAGDKVGMLRGCQGLFGSRWGRLPG